MGAPSRPDLHVPHRAVRRELASAPAGCPAPDTPPSEIRQARHNIPIGPTAPALAREALVEITSASGLSLRSDAQLLVSELVSHRVRGARSDRQGMLGLGISMTPRCVRIEVTDEDHRPVFVSPDPGEPTLGWELQIVAKLADRWGIRHDTITTLWFELDF